MNTTVFKKALVLIAFVFGFIIRSNASVTYSTSTISSGQGFSFTTDITITGINVVAYYSPGNFLYNVQLEYTNTFTGQANSHAVAKKFWTYEIGLYRNQTKFQTAQDVNDVMMTTAAGTMTSYGPNTGTSMLVTGTGLYTDNAVINSIMNGVSLSVNGPGIANQTVSTTVTSSSTPLPVQFSQFAVKQTNDGARLSWTTQMEQQNKGFYVERSADGSHWNSIDFVQTLASEGNSTEALTYSYTDTKASGKSYYRLKQEDWNGATTYSSVVWLDAQTDNQLSVYPNPATTQVTVSGVNDAAAVQIWNNLGQVQQANMQASGNQVTITLDNLSNGIYYIHVGQQQYKIIVRK